MISKQFFTEEEIKHRKDLLEFYRTEDGTMELARRLKDLKFFDQIQAGEIVMRNYGITVLEELGILDQDKIVDVVRALLALPAFKDESKKKMNGNIPSIRR